MAFDRKQYERDRWANNPKRREADARRKAANRAGAAAVSKAWREAHPEEYKAQLAAWRVANRDKTAAYARQRQLALKLRTPEGANRELMVEMQKCADHLTETTGQTWGLDHMIPLQGKLVSGLHVPLNLRICTMDFNRRKARKFEVAA